MLKITELYFKVVYHIVWELNLNIKNNDTSSHPPAWEDKTLPLCVWACTALKSSWKAMVSSSKDEDGSASDPAISLVDNMHTVTEKQ